MTKHAIVLLSGGLDSSVVLAQAIKNKRKCRAIAFDYGQRHRLELRAAKALARYYQSEIEVIRIDPYAFASNALHTGVGLAKNRTAEGIADGGIPQTNVPGRNTLFLAYALGQALKHQAEEIYFGANVMDALPYPDCRPEYVKAFQKVMNLAGSNKGPKIVTPLIELDKTEIILKSQELEVPVELTLSCYDPTARAEHCGACDACMLRKQGFKQAGISDPTIYKK